MYKIMAKADCYDSYRLRCVVTVQCLCFFRPSPSYLPSRGTLHQGAGLICLSKRVLPPSPTPTRPPSLKRPLPIHTHTHAPSVRLSPAAAAAAAVLLATAGPAPAPAASAGEIEMLRVGTTAPLIKFPRLIPADPQIALSHQAPQGDRGQGPGGTTNKHSLLTVGMEKIQKWKKKKKAKRESEKLEMKQGEMRCMRWGGAGAAERSTCVDKQTQTHSHCQTIMRKLLLTGFMTWDSQRGGRFWTPWLAAIYIMWKDVKKYQLTRY